MPENVDAHLLKDNQYDADVFASSVPRERDAHSAVTCSVEVPQLIMGVASCCHDPCKVKQVILYCAVRAL